MVATNTLHLHPVDAPQVAPEIHNLVSSAHQPGVDVENRWEAGVTFVPEGDDTLSTHAVETGSPDAKSTAKAAPALVEARSFLIEGAWTRPSGSYTNAEIEAMAHRAMEQTQSSKIEAVLCAGDPSTTAPYLIDSNCTKLGTTAVKAAVGLGRIQAAFAAIGGHGTVYVSPLIAAVLAQGNTFVEDNDGKLYTAARGDLVIVSNMGVAGPAATATGDDSFIYGHLGEPELRMSEIQIYLVPAADRNNTIVRVERTVSVTFAPGQWATLVASTA